MYVMNGTNSKTDQELVLAYSKGDEQAFHTLIKRHMNGVFRCALSFCRDSETAEDIAQETFVKAWRHIGKYNPNYAFSTWISAIAKNTALDFLKKRTTIPFSAFGSQELIAMEAAGTISAVNLNSFKNKTADSASINTALKNLSSQDRSVINMHYQQGYTFEEIGKKIDKPMNTVKTWHRRAIQRLKENF